MSIRRVILWAVGVILLGALVPWGGGAAGATAKSFTPRHGQTVAILPFRFAVKEGAAGQGMDTDPAEAAGLVREQVVANLRRAPWRLMELNHVDAVLANRGWTSHEALASAGPRAVGEALGADLLWYGEITRWGRHYMLIHSQVEVGATVRLLSPMTGEVVWERSGEKVRTAGLTKIPTGIGGAALSPILGMQKAFLYEITHELARELTDPLVPASGEAPPTAEPPELLVAAAHAGSDGLVEPGDRITVVALGQPALTATFAVGPERRNLPMTEFGPGRYVGTYEVAAGDHFPRVPITVDLITQAGGLTTTTLASPVVRTQPSPPAP